MTPSTDIITDLESRTLAASLAATAALQEMRPSLRYEPGRSHDLDGKPIDPRDNGQLQFHMSRHMIRTCAPGNGWGKTAVIAVEVDWWAFGDHPWPYEIPLDRPRKIVWIAQTYKQWSLIRTDIEAWWPKSVVQSWRGQPHFDYTWPNGSTLSVITAETDPDSVAGIQPHLVVGDEEIPRKLANEMRARRRADTKTRYVFNGTALNGLNWQYRELYLNWLQFHQKRGLSEHDAMRAQLHDYGDVNPLLSGTPGIWCWPTGSHADNPRATKLSWAGYQATFSTFSKIEREVRLYGGYRDFNASPVFDLDSLERQRANLRPGRRGWFLPSTRRETQGSDLPFVIGAS